MRASLRLCSLISAAALVTTGLSTATAAPEPEAHDRGTPRGAGLELSLAGTYNTGIFDASAAEISAFDHRTDRLFVVNASSGAVDILEVGKGGAPEFETSLQVAGLRAADGSTVDQGAVVNSVAVSRGLLAVAVEAADKVDHGWVLLFDTRSLDYLAGLRAGALPDSVAFDKRGRTLVVANEGEPADDFSTDPEGTISIVDLPASTRRIHQLDQGDVRTVDFRAFDEGTPLPEGVRVVGPDVPVPPGQDAAGYVARNLEPEYVTVLGRTAYVSLQEANAVAVVDLRAGELERVWPLTSTDWSTEGRLDASNEDGPDGEGAINLANWPVFGTPMPDGLASYRWRGQDLVLTANEGDSREWGDFVDTERVKDLTLCESSFDDVDALTDDAALGRLNVLTDLGFDEEQGCYEELHALGSRSFSIYSERGERLFDSGGMIEATIVDLIDAGELPEHAFNANNDETPSFDARSDDKGPEPESVEIGTVRGRTYAFVALERIGGVMVFDVTDPRSVSYVTYVNDRNWDAVGDSGEDDLGDLGAEGLEFVAAKDSPSKEALLIVSNEVSGTTTVYEVSPVTGRRQ